MSNLNNKVVTYKLTQEEIAEKFKNVKSVDQKEHEKFTIGFMRDLGVKAKNTKWVNAK